MMNILRADLYRILRGKSLYITFAVLLAIVALMVAASAEITMGVNMRDVDANVYSNDFQYDGLNAAEALYKNMNILPYIMLPLIITVSAAVFSCDAVKNELSFGASRMKLYLSKLVLSSVVCVLLMLLYMAFGMLFATAMRGFGGPAPEGYWPHILKVCASNLLLLIAFNCVGTFLVFATKRTAAVIGAYFGFCFVPSIVIALLAYLNPDLVRLFDYDLMTGLLKMGYIGILPSADIVKALALGVFYIIASTAAGLMLFRKAEIK
jgi:ABC-type transport system involved in multi-copper enzyme maturation permease subunit